jgi:hypothetical protein
MLNPVTPWTATVQSDIINGNLLWEAKISQYQLRIYNAGDSLWLTVEWPEGGTIAQISGLAKRMSPFLL